ncbi:MAG: prepilin peptidase [Candidatus Omnitrophica bacterium]|nr:prepilin peptidase [Candidatus Omnitrophota bacterium]
MKVFFYILIAITGSLTIFSDIKQRKIKNQHLLPIIVISLISYVFFIASGKLVFSPQLIYNLAAAAAIGLILYYARLWEAGDAKLFITYSLLLPTAVPMPLLPLPSLLLFFITFLLSFMLILPPSIYGIIINRALVIKQVLSVQTLNFFINILIIVLGLSWIVQPLILSLPIKNSVFFVFIVTYAGYILLFRLVAKIKKPLILAAVFILGFGLRLLINPAFFSLKNIGLYLAWTLIFALIFYLINLVISFQGKRPVRIPFSPFMFIGALVTNSNAAVKIISFFYNRF